MHEKSGGAGGMGGRSFGAGWGLRLVVVLLLRCCAVRTAPLQPGGWLQRAGASQMGTARLPLFSGRWCRQRDTLWEGLGRSDTECDARESLTQERAGLGGEQQFAFITSVPSLSKPGYQLRAQGARCRPRPAVGTVSVTDASWGLQQQQQLGNADRTHRLAKVEEDAVIFANLSSLARGERAVPERPALAFASSASTIIQKLAVKVQEQSGDGTKKVPSLAAKLRAAASAGQGVRGAITIGDAQKLHRIPSLLRLDEREFTTGHDRALRKEEPQIQTLEKLNGLSGRYEMRCVKERPEMESDEEEWPEDDAESSEDEDAYNLKSAQSADDIFRPLNFDIDMDSDFEGSEEVSSDEECSELYYLGHEEAQKPDGQLSLPGHGMALCEQFTSPSSSSSPTQPFSEAWHAPSFDGKSPTSLPSHEWLGEGDKVHKRLIPCVAGALDRLSKLGGTGVPHQTPFHAKKRPKVSLLDYAERIAKFSGCSSGCFVVAMVYMDRLLAKDGKALSGLNVHRLLLACMLSSAKLWDDFHYNNGFWAKIGGVSNEELNSLEEAVMKGLGWRANVDTYEFEAYREALASLRGDDLSGLERPWTEDGLRLGRAMKHKSWARRPVYQGLIHMAAEAGKQGKLAVVVPEGSEHECASKGAEAIVGFENEEMKGIACAVPVMCAVN